MSKDIRKYANDTQVRLIAGAILLLFTVGIGMIWAIYGFGAAVMGFLCLLGAFVPIGLIVVVLNFSDWILKRSGRD